MNESMRLLALLSGGIDSPAACYLMLKSGFEVEYLHFFLGEKSIEKIVMIVAKLKEVGGSSRIFLIPFSTLIQLVTKLGDERYTCINCKRAMLKTAEALAKKIGCSAILTGDSLGQVASQTVPNLFVEDSAIQISILRPLIGFDKEEIVEIAKKAETYRLSILRDEGCKAVPSRPVTKARIERARDFDVSAVLLKLKEINV
jgi:thiamine biosynthesis protein ThiI